MNKISLLGRVGQTPEIKTFSGANGDFKVCNNLSLAVRRDKDNTDWIPLKVKGKTTEILDKYVVKGDLILVDGSLQIESWTDSANNKKSKMVVIVDKIYLLPNEKKSTATVVKTEVVTDYIPDIDF